MKAPWFSRPVHGRWSPQPGARSSRQRADAGGAAGPALLHRSPWPPPTCGARRCLARQPSLQWVLNEDSPAHRQALARDGESIDGLIARADQATDRAKQAGRNPVITIEEATPFEARAILTRSHETTQKTVRDRHRGLTHPPSPLPAFNRPPFRVPAPPGRRCRWRRTPADTRCCR